MTRLVFSLAGDIAASQCHPNVRPQPAATVILYDTDGASPRFLFGRRHPGHIFMANAYVFPGGRVEPRDRHVPMATDPHPLIEAKLGAATLGHSAAAPRALVVAALRELAEEAGFCIGTKANEGQLRRLADFGASWTPFVEAGLVPDPSGLRLISRAVTPPRIVRRYDTWFFAADAASVRHRVPDVVGPESELTELMWMTLDDARAAPLSPIVRQIVEDVAARLRAGLDPAAPVPFYRASGGHMVRDWL